MVLREGTGASALRSCKAHKQMQDWQEGGMGLRPLNQEKASYRKPLNPPDICCKHLIIIDHLTCTHQLKAGLCPLSDDLGSWGLR